RERRVGALDPQMNVAADELERGVAHEDTWQEAGLAENLEAVADPEHEPTLTGMRTHRVHDRRTGRDRAAAQIVTIGEAARNDGQAGAGRQRVLRMPDHRGRAAGDDPQRARHVALAIDAGEDDDGGLHQEPSSFSAQRSTRSLLRKSMASRSAALSC